MNELQQKLARRRNLNGEIGGSNSNVGKSNGDLPPPPPTTPSFITTPSVVAKSIKEEQKSSSGPSATDELRAKLFRRRSLNGEINTANTSTEHINDSTTPTTTSHSENNLTENHLCELLSAIHSIPTESSEITVGGTHITATVGGSATKRTKTTRESTINIPTHEPAWLNDDSPDEIVTAAIPDALEDSTTAVECEQHLPFALAGEETSVVHEIIFAHPQVDNECASIIAQECCCEESNSTVAAEIDTAPAVTDPAPITDETINTNPDTDTGIDSHHVETTEQSDDAIMISNSISISAPTSPKCACEIVAPNSDETETLADETTEKECCELVTTVPPMKSSVSHENVLSQEEDCGVSEEITAVSVTEDIADAVNNTSTIPLPTANSTTNIVVEDVDSIDALVDAVLSQSSQSIHPTELTPVRRKEFQLQDLQENSAILYTESSVVVEEEEHDSYRGHSYSVSSARSRSSEHIIISARNSLDTPREAITEIASISTPSPSSPTKPINSRTRTSSSSSLLWYPGKYLIERRAPWVAKTPNKQQLSLNVEQAQSMYDDFVATGKTLSVDIDVSTSVKTEYSGVDTATATILARSSEKLHHHHLHHHTMMEQKEYSVSELLEENQVLQEEIARLKNELATKQKIIEAYESASSQSMLLLREEEQVQAINNNSSSKKRVSVSIQEPDVVNAESNIEDIDLDALTSEVQQAYHIHSIESVEQTIITPIASKLDVNSPAYVHSSDVLLAAATTSVNSPTKASSSAIHLMRVNGLGLYDNDDEDDDEDEEDEEEDNHHNKTDRHRSHRLKRNPHVRSSQAYKQPPNLHHLIDDKKGNKDDAETFTLQDSELITSKESEELHLLLDHHNATLSHHNHNYNPTQAATSEKDLIRSFVNPSFTNHHHDEQQSGYNKALVAHGLVTMTPAKPTQQDEEDQDADREGEELPQQEEATTEVSSSSSSSSSKKGNELFDHDGNNKETVVEDAENNGNSNESLELHTMSYQEFLLKFTQCHSLINSTRLFIWSILGPLGDGQPGPKSKKPEYIFYGTTKLDERCRQFFDEMQDTFLSFPSFANEHEERILSARDHLENYVMQRVGESAFGLFWKECEQEDAHILKQMKLLSHFLTPQALDIKEDLFEDTLLTIAGEELRKINLFRTPGEKIDCVIKCVTIIFRSLSLARTKQEVLITNNPATNTTSSSEEEQDQDSSTSSSNNNHSNSSSSTANLAGADDFLPLFIWVVIRSQIPRLLTNCEYIQTYLSPARLMSKPGYCLINLRSAVEFVNSLDPSCLTMEASEFEAQYQAAEALYAQGKL